MHRKAILIASHPEKNSVPSVAADLEAFYSFLRSNPGGAWDTAEIVLLKHPKREEILAAITAAKSADYCLVYFAGHGEIVKMGLPWSEMKMELDSGETITEREINSGSPRCTFILDCGYRTGEKTPETKSNEPPQLHSNAEASVFLNLYEASLKAAEGGLVKAYATAASTAAPDAHSFTQHLLKQANSWVRTHKGTLYLGDAVTLAMQAIQQENIQHRVEYRRGRRLHDFPFAVQI
jgi:Caspase domain